MNKPRRLWYILALYEVMCVWFNQLCVDAFLHHMASLHHFLPTHYSGDSVLQTLEAGGWEGQK